MRPTPARLALILALLATPAGAADYLAEVKPLLAKRCYACHGALRQKANLRLDTAGAIRKGGDSGPAVDLDDPEASPILERVAESDPHLRMPPEGEGEALSAGEVEAIRAWVAAGAPAPEAEEPQADPRDHWAFGPPVRPEVPKVEGARNPVDAFLAAAREAKGLAPATPADRATLLRRASVDLTGLVPTPEELAAFLADESADAYEKAVERLLASPRYGERWGRHWMDVWRYSDWAGFGDEVRESQPHIWRWRDWIVESLNAGVGYDRMVVAMLAGDEAAPEDPDSLRATGYLVRSWYKFNRDTWLQNTVEHAGKAFLGLTFNCARCHDHKYDPIAQADYYRFRAFFEPHDIRVDRLPGGRDTKALGMVRVQDAHPDRPTYLYVRGDDKRPDKDRPLGPGLPAFLGATGPIEPVPIPLASAYQGMLPHVRDEERGESDRRLAEAEENLAKARKAEDDARAARVAAAVRLDATDAERAQAEKAVAEADGGLRMARLHLDAARAARAALEARIAADDAKYADPPDSKRAEVAALAAARAERTAAALRAEADLAGGESVLAAARRALAETPDDPKAKNNVEAGEREVKKFAERLEKARAEAEKLSSEYTPLTPVHPRTSTGRRLALARWITAPENPLAARVAVNHVWLRHFGRPLVPTVFDLGVNGRRPSHPELLDWLAVEFREGGWDLKALHRLLVTSDAYRMRSSAEAGDPNASIDPENAFYWRMNPRRMEAEAVRDNLLHVAGSLDPTMGGPEIDQGKGLEVPRRSLYFRHAAEKQVLFLQVFDAANVSSCYRRDESVVPQQALALANSPLALAQARVLAGKIEAADDAVFVTEAFGRVLGRGPTDEERSACLAFLASQAARLAEPAALSAIAEGAEAPVAPAADPAARAREGLVHVLLNHNDFVTVR